MKSVVLLISLLALTVLGPGSGCRKNSSQQESAPAPAPNPAPKPASSSSMSMSPMIVAPPMRPAARPSGPPVHTWSLDAIPLGDLPPSFLSLKGRWKVSTVRTTGPDIRTVEQSARSANPVYNLLLVKGLRLADVTIRVRILSVSGKLDQGGGVVWRASGGRNYYITRYNPLEDNLRLYTVKGGRRKQLASVGLKVASGKWFGLTVRMKGDHIQVHMDSKKRIDLHDKTFTAPGSVGLWTKADARTHFTDLRVEKAD